MSATNSSLTQTEDQVSKTVQLSAENTALIRKTAFKLHWDIVNAARQLRPSFTCSLRRTVTASRTEPSPNLGSKIVKVVEPSTEQSVWKQEAIKVVRKAKQSQPTVDVNDLPVDRTQGSNTDASTPIAGPVQNFCVGDRVKCRFSSGAELYTATVTVVHADGTYDISYDLGGRESRKSAALLYRYHEKKVPQTKDQDSPKSVPPPSLTGVLSTRQHDTPHFFQNKDEIEAQSQHRHSTKQLADKSSNDNSNFPGKDPPKLLNRGNPGRRVYLAPDIVYRHRKVAGVKKTYVQTKSDAHSNLISQKQFRDGSTSIKLKSSSNRHVGSHKIVLNKRYESKSLSALRLARELCVAAIHDKPDKIFTLTTVSKQADGQIFVPDDKSSIKQSVSARSQHILVATALNLPVLGLAKDTPLVAAVRAGRLKTVGALLSVGADMAAANGAGDSALHVAFRCKNPAVARLLINSNADVNLANQAGFLPHEVSDISFQKLLAQTATYFDAPNV